MYFFFGFFVFFAIWILGGSVNANPTIVSVVNFEFVASVSLSCVPS